MIRSGVDPADPASPNGLTSSADQAELVLQRPEDGLAAGAADVQVGRPAPPVADREDLVGGQQPERRQRDGDPEDDAGDDVGRVVLGQVEPGQAR